MTLLTPRWLTSFRMESLRESERMEKVLLSELGPWCAESTRRSLFQLFQLVWLMLLRKLNVRSFGVVSPVQSGAVKVGSVSGVGSVNVRNSRSASDAVSPAPLLLLFPYKGCRYWSVPFDEWNP